MSLRFQEFSNCMVQLNLDPLPGLAPASSKGVIKRFTPRSVVLAVVTDAMLKQGRIDKDHALACGALIPKDEPKKGAKS